MRAIRAALLAAIALSVASAASVRAVLIDSKESQPKTAAIKSILESSSAFQVDVLTAPAKGAPFDVPFDRYKLVVLNYGGDSWPVETMAALAKYVENGGGLVALVSADPAFPMWPEYNLMLGVDGATNRDKGAGPIWFYHAGNLAVDNDSKDVPDPGSSKAPKPDQPFLVTIRNTEHPIAKGLPLEWMHASDTLLGNLRGPGKNLIVLATAHSDEKAGGTGRDEPVLLAITYGKGRIFHTLLGSTADGASCVGFQTALQRGAEWAATGKVTPRMPSDFPHEDKPSTRPLK